MPQPKKPPPARQPGRKSSGKAAPTPRTRDREATEAAIIEAARGVLAREGFAALNILTIAQAAGVDRKLIYRYFTDLDGLLARLGAQSEAWLGDAQARVKNANPRDYADAVTVSLKAYGEAIQNEDTLLGILAWELAAPNATLSALDAARGKAMQGVMAAARGEHVPPAGVDAPAVIAVAVAALNYLALKRRAVGRFSGIALDAAGQARVAAVIERLLQTQLRTPAGH